MVVSNKQKVILIGDGAVGSAYAFALVNQGIGHELGIIDVDTARTEGDALDLRHALPFLPPKKIYSASYTDCADADLICITAGTAQKPGETRLDLVSRNLSILKTIVDAVMATGFKGIFLIASNPVDILTYATLKWSGLPSEQVIGSGTSLDTARLRQTLAEKINVEAGSVHGYVLGEHGDTGFIAWSNIRIGNLPIEKWLPDFTDEAKEEFRIAVRDAAYSIIAKKGSTSYGVASALARITRAVFNNENAVLPVSAYMDGSHYGISDIYLGTPAVIGRSGISLVAEVPLNRKEQEEMEHSAATLKAILKDSIV
ncbi:L-lactate dehydrogenase [Brochothrix campestris]|uniref:L-lactate dehydrogenase n=1 Tax=Brochothrix campestris FSL F6-1037 TaxID=1265861 RepID=W7CGK6_9LIST|nr:L-lactate dehydrogenase [Brochothrix campestris]EUJ36062.1 L-lactate dehydrogenase [Brochothrix campestris FSL F6-1037]